MLRNNLKVSLRILKRDKLYAVINTLGLSVGLAIALLIIIYVKFELSYEKYNLNSAKIARITIDYLNGETIIEQDCETYPPLAKRIVDEIPEAIRSTRAYQIDERIIQIEEDYYREGKLYAVDPTFFSMFNYPLLNGSTENLFVAPYEAVLTESLAIKYFKTTNVVGKVITIPSIDKNFEIKGIIKDAPASTHLKFNLLISFPTMKASFGEKDDNWNGNNTFTYVELADQNSFAQFAQSISKLSSALTEEEKIENERVISQPVRDIHLYSNKTFEPEQNGDALSVFFLLGVAILVIIIAIVNYVNLSTAKSLDRAKEVGIRKVVGSSLYQLRSQFFTESMLINLFAGFLAIVFMILFLPFFRDLASLPMDFTFFSDYTFWLILTGILLVSTLLSGVFPAYILSSFKPVAILKGKFTHSTQGSLLRKSLVIFQFAIMIFLLIQTMTANQQIHFMRNKDLGLNMERTVVVRAPQSGKVKANYPAFKKSLLNLSHIKSVTTSSSVPGMPAHQMSTTTGIKPVEQLNDHNFNFYITFTDSDFIPSMEMQLMAGNNFIANSKSKNQIIVNEEAIRLWGYANPSDALGKQIAFWGEKPRIIGVIKNFHQTTAKSAHIPMIFIHNDSFDELASIKLTSGDLNQQIEQIESIYLSMFQNTPFEFFFMDQAFDQLYREDEQFQEVFSVLTGLALVIACLGLFGLVSFSVTKRTKEIGIRKVLGARVTQILLLLSKDYLKLILLSTAIALPITYFIISSWLDRYAYRIELNIWIFTIPVVGVLLIAISTIFVKTFQVSNANPVQSLRDE